MLINKDINIKFKDYKMSAQSKDKAAPKGAEKKEMLKSQIEEGKTMTAEESIR